MAEYTYTVVFEPVAEGGYNVIVPALPESYTCGETLEEARRMAVDAIKCALKSMRNDNEPIPSDLEVPRQRFAVSLS